MAAPSFRDIVPLAAGLIVTAVLSFALGSLTTYWAMHGSRTRTVAPQMAVGEPVPAPASVAFPSSASQPVASLLIPAAAAAPAPAPAPAAAPVTTIAPEPEQVSASPSSFDPDAIELEPQRGSQGLTGYSEHGESL